MHTALKCAREKFKDRINVSLIVGRFKSNLSIKQDVVKVNRYIIVLKYALDFPV